MLHVSVGHQDVAALCFDDLEIAAAHAAVAVAFDADDRHVEFVRKIQSVPHVVSRVYDQIDIPEFAPDISDFIQFAVCISDD